MQVYLDESGDLGWNFNKPFRQGGSSRFLALAFLFLPSQSRRAPRHLIRDLYRKYQWKDEKKANAATISQKILFCQKTVELLKRHSGVKIDVIVVNKGNVQSHIRSDPNKLYNYMTSLIVPDYVRSEKEIEFIPDERSVKVRSGNSLADYLQIKLWFDCGLKTKIINNPGVSRNNYNLQFVDWVAHCIWIKYEDGELQPFEILSPFIKVRQLYF